jgi:hypothetical protein
MNGNASDMFFETLADQDSDFAINLVALLRSKDPNLTLGDDLSPSPPPEPSNAGPAQNEVDMITGFGSLESWVQTFGEDAREHVGPSHQCYIILSTNGYSTMTSSLKQPRPFTLSLLTRPSNLSRPRKLHRWNQRRLFLLPPQPALLELLNTS